jgi:hypothetical protein
LSWHIHFNLNERKIQSGKMEEVIVCRMSCFCATWKTRLVYTNVVGVSWTVFNAHTTCTTYEATTAYPSITPENTMYNRIIIYILKIYIQSSRVWRYQRGNQNPYIEEEQTTQWPKDTKWVMRIRISKKNRQHNDQNKDYKRTNNISLRWWWGPLCTRATRLIGSV